MDEIELRLAALETALFELVAWLDPAAADDAMASIRAGLRNTSDPDERAVRQAALQLLEDGRRRFAGTL